MVCPKEKGPDFDFGASVIQSVDKDGNKFWFNRRYLYKIANDT